MDVTAARWVHQGYQLVRHVVPAIARPAHSLWHEVIGFFFLVLAFMPIPSAIRTIREMQHGAGSPVRLFLTVPFVVIMGGYGISSFRRARKIARS
jgi:hypothetical protein